MHATQESISLVCLLDEMFTDLQHLNFSCGFPSLSRCCLHFTLWDAHSWLNCMLFCLWELLHISLAPVELRYSQPVVQNAGSRRRRWYSFTQLYYFLPLVLIPKAEDYFQMCPAASPVITWVLGRTTQRCGLGIFVPLEATCGLSFDIEKQREELPCMTDWKHVQCGRLCMWSSGQGFSNVNWKCQHPLPAREIIWKLDTVTQFLSSLG